MWLLHLPTGQVPNPPEVLVGRFWVVTLTLDRERLLSERSGCNSHIHSLGVGITTDDNGLSYL